MKKGATPKDSIIVVVHVDDLLSVGKRKNLGNFFAQLVKRLKLERVGVHREWQVSAILR